MVKEITVKASDIPRGERKIIDVDGISIAVFSIADKFYAIDSACPHQGGPLGNGELVDATTIQVSEELLDELKIRKISDKESYEEIIWDLIDDTMELSDETKREIEKA